MEGASNEDSWPVRRAPQLNMPVGRSSPLAAAALSFLWPGLGHLYVGRRRPAVVFALPALAAVFVVAGQALLGIERLAVSLVTPSGALTVLVLVVLLGVWRLLALADATMIASRARGRASRAHRVGVAVLALLIIGMHTYGTQVSYALYEAGSRMFVGAGPDDGSGASPDAGGIDDPDDEYVAPPVAPDSETDRINILLTGVDSAETRSHALTDTLLVVSVDPRDGSLAMISFPRDIANFPLYDGRTFKGKINSLMSWARRHPAEFPDGPFPTLVKQIGYLLGSPIHYYAAVDMAGFRRMIDEVGGITVSNERAINDPAYDWLDGSRGFALPAGKVSLDGRTALAFVRSRQGAGDNDYTRAGRQQQLLVALRQSLLSPAMLPRLPALVQIGGDVVRTNVPESQLERLLEVARDMDGGTIRRIVLGPPFSTHPPTSSTGGVWTLRLDLDRLAALSVELFGTGSRYSTD
jgi:polyisoprenyl-teichoic acid--peptidoglycan teichoic acid transferase